MENHSKNSNKSERISNRPEHLQKSNVIQFEQCIDFLNKAGKAYISPKFKIYEQDYQLIFKLLVYVYKDTKNAERAGIDFRKGVLLTGPIGCGKTSLMTLLRLFLSPKEQHIMKSTRDINYEFIQDGYPVINKYSKSSFHASGGENIPRTYCFDDLGVESNIKYYGNNTNVMGEILLSRYDMFIRHRMLTHITTNLTAAEIESLYGNRVRSRLREMFNLVSFDKDVKDKRR